MLRGPADSEGIPTGNEGRKVGENCQVRIGRPCIIRLFPDKSAAT
jgi:hypothetical protein